LETGEIAETAKGFERKRWWLSSIKDSGSTEGFLPDLVFAWLANVQLVSQRGWWAN